MLPVLSVCVQQYHQFHLQRRGKERLEKELLQTISLKARSVQWVREEEEILVDGRLFDVKSYSIKNGTYTFTGLYDEDETMVVRKIRSQENQQQSNDSRMLAQLFKLLKTVYYSESDPCTPFVQSSQELFPGKKYPLSFLYQPVTTPPPRS